MTNKKPQPKTETGSVLDIAQPKHWLILINTLIILGVLIVWSVVGRIPTEAEGQSVSLSSGGVFLIQGGAEGIVKGIFVREGEVVKKNSPLAIIDTSKIIPILASIDSTKFKIAKLEEEALLLSHALVINEGLFVKGVIAKMTVDNSKSALMEKQIEIEGAKSSLESLFSDLALNSFTNEETFKKQRALLEKPFHSLNFKEVEEALSTILSPSNGTVLEVLVNEGEFISSDQSVLWMEYPPKPTKSNIFLGTLSADAMGRLKRKLKVLIEPASVNPREYGAIIGEIEEIYPYPVSKAELMQSIANMQIVDYLFGGRRASTEILITPSLDPSTPSGYKWTSEKGPPFEIASGTVCKIRVTIDEQPPISYLIPLWRIKPQ